MERTDTGEFTERVALDDVLEVIQRATDPIVTTRDVAEALNCSTESARRKLIELHEQGSVDRRKVGSRAVVWWATDG